MSTRSSIAYNANANVSDDGTLDYCSSFGNNNTSDLYKSSGNLSNENH